MVTCECGYSFFSEHINNSSKGLSPLLTLFLLLSNNFLRVVGWGNGWNDCDQPCTSDLKTCEKRGQDSLRVLEDNKPGSRLITITKISPKGCGFPRKGSTAIASAFYKRQTIPPTSNRLILVSLCAMSTQFPPGYLEAYDGHKLVATCISCMVLIIFFVAARFTSRALHHTPKGWDDYLMVPALIFALLLALQGLSE